MIIHIQLFFVEFGISLLSNLYFDIKKIQNYIFYKQEQECQHPKIKAKQTNGPILVLKCFAFDKNCIKHDKKREELFL